MVRMIKEMVRRRAVVEVGVRDHTHLLKDLEVAIDGGQRQGGPAVSGDSRCESIRCGVTESLDGIGYSLPLAGQPHAPGPQPYAKVLHSCEPTRRPGSSYGAGSTPASPDVLNRFTGSPARHCQTSAS